MSPPPSPTSRPSSPSFNHSNTNPPTGNKDAVPPSSFYSTIPPRRAGSSHTTYSIRNTSPDPPPYLTTTLSGEAIDPDYKPPIAVPASPPDTPALISDSPLRIPQSGFNGYSGGGTGWTPNVSGRDTPASDAWAVTPLLEFQQDYGIDSVPPSIQYGSGEFQDQFVENQKFSDEKTLSTAIDRGIQVSTIWEITDIHIPDLPPDHPPRSTPGGAQSPALLPPGSPGLSATSSSSSSSSPSPHPRIHPHPPPTLAELRTAILRPLYLHIPLVPFGWIPIIVSSSSYPPLLEPHRFPPLPDWSGKRPTLCHGLRPGAHHIHPYKASVLPSALTPPLHEMIGPLPPLDLWFCCQCPLHVILPSDVAQPRRNTVIDHHDLEEFLRERAEDPPVGMSGPEAVLRGIETILLMNDNLLWKGKHSFVKVNNVAFNRKVGWNPTVRRIVESLGWTVSSESEVAAAVASGLQAPTASTTGFTSTTDGQLLIPPKIPLGSLARENLLRACIELGAFTRVWRLRHPTMMSSDYKCWVDVRDPTKSLEDKVGVSAMYRFGNPKDRPSPVSPASDNFRALGLGPKYTAELIQRAYELQVKCHAEKTSLYYGALDYMIKHHLLSSSDEADISLLVTMEKSKGRVNCDEVSDAYSFLGFGKDGDGELQMDGRDSTDDDIWLAWQHVVDHGESKWKPELQGGEPTRGRQLKRNISAFQPSTRDEFKRDMKEVLRTIAEFRNSPFLQMKLNNGEADRRFGMDPETAFRVLEVPQEIEDDVLMTVFQMRVTDQPTQQERMVDALKAIAVQRNSARLRRFLETGNPGEDEAAIVQVPLEYPRGLDQLGNTCYLNSLLQYFYTIKDLRESIIDSTKIEDDVELINSGALALKRVGGRLITKKEIQRSTQFVRLLSFLFVQLSLAETASVTPEIELAKLALVTSQDEEEESTSNVATKVVTDVVSSSPVDLRTAPSSDITLVDEPMALDVAPTPEPPRSPPSTRSPPPFTSAPSVLGKRDRNSRVKAGRATMMDIQDSALGIQIEGIPEASNSVQRSSTLPVLGDRSNIDIDELARSASMSMDIDPVRAERERASLPEEGDIEMTSADEPISQSPEASTSANKENEAPSTYAQTEARKPPPLPPRSSMKKPEVQSESLMMFGRQHDVSECMDNCMFQIEAALKPDQSLDPENGETSLIKRLFYGKIRQRLTAASGLPADSSASIHEKDDLFAHLHINVGDEGFDLYDGLGGYFEDVVEFGGHAARMDVTLVDLPPLLQIQLQRVQFDRETMQPYKSNAYVKFGETLSVDRFLDSADPQKRERSKTIRRELGDCRDRIKALTQGKGGNFADSLSETRLLLEEQKTIDLPEWDLDFSDFLKAEHEDLTKEIESLRSRVVDLKIELESTWADDHEAEYELSSVFMHRGNHAFGHYWFYSRWLPDHPDSWFKYNDSSVTLVPKEEVLGDATGSTANPYLLVFSRKGSDTIDTVKRLLV